MTDVHKLITDNIDVWTSAIKKKSAAGRGSSKKIELTGVKKLRELILELAVRGKLLAQHPNDEPASILLEKVAEKKVQLIADKKIKKQKALPRLDVEKTLSLPTGWETVRFIDVLDFSGGGQPPKSFFSEEKLDGYVQLIQIRDLGPNPQPVYIPKEKASKFCTENDVMVGRYGASVGKVFWGKDGAYNVALIRIHNDLDSYFNGFIFLLLKSPLGQKLFTGISRSAQDGFNKDDIAPALLPLPPLAEQQRIVAKVEELMALCDQLEQQTEQSLTAHQTLVEVLLNALFLSPTQINTGTDVQEQAQASVDEQLIAKDIGNERVAGASSLQNSFQENWQRIADHFDVLFTTEASIDQLKQTILQLAVMGKLVPHNPNDEPANKLLERIAEEKAQLIKDKKIKKQKPLSAITDEEKPFELPSGWEWVRFEDVVDIQGGITKGRKLAGRELIKVPYLSVANVQRSYLDLGYLKEVEIPITEKEKYRVQERDLLITEGGDWDKVGRTAIWANELPYVGHQNHVFKARIFIKEQCEVWLEKYLNGPFARNYFAGSSKQTTNLASINKTQLRGCMIAMPPSNEMQLIVTKVDELMTLCDQLKTRLADAQITQLHLADAVVEQAL